MAAAGSTASSQFPEGLIWPTPSIESYFKPANLAGVLGLDYRHHWVAVDHDRIIGSISLVSQPDLSSMHLLLAAAADWRGKAGARSAELCSAAGRPHPETGDAELPGWTCG